MAAFVAILPPFSLYNAERPASPLMLSVPHAGRDYPGPLLDALRVPAGTLLRLEDRYADRLVQPAIAAGQAAIVAHRARAWADLNRAEADFDRTMFSGAGIPSATPGAKTRGGLGLIPRRLHGVGELWRTSFDADDYRERIQGFHRPYHQAIRSTLASIHATYGTAILLDVHSMPPLGQSAGQQFSPDTAPQFVVGDRFGRTAGSRYTDSTVTFLRDMGYRVALNAPYPGDYLLETHGRPAANIHALQLEIDRSLYLDAAWQEPTEQMDSIARLVLSLVQLLAALVQGQGYAEAAE